MPSKKIPTLLRCKCGTEKVIQCLNNRDYSNWKCRSCSIKLKWQDKSYRAKRKSKTKPKSAQKKPTKTAAEIKAAISEAAKLSWATSRAKRLKALQDCREKRTEIAKKMWLQNGFADKYKTPKHRAKMQKIAQHNWANPESRKRQGEKSKQLWNSDEYRNKILATKSTVEFKQKMAAIQANPTYKEKLAKALANQPKVSSLQTTLYSILDDLGVDYFREYNDKPDDPECVIGPWNFDCVVPRNDNTTLLIECQGDFIHSLPGKKQRDTAKATFIARYHHDYELKYIWEHEFCNHNYVVETLKYWLGISKSELVDFKYPDIKIKRSKANEYIPLLKKYHYLFNAGRGGIAYGAYYHGKLIAICVFSPLGRQNIQIKNYGPDEVRELSRFCIYPRYQKKNFGSWFISRCIKLLPAKYRAIISYCDTTFNHDGSIYKASNFELDQEVKPDYWYTSPDGWIMHKKTLYNKAINLSMKEREYAERFGYLKVWGRCKLRFIYRRTKSGP